jgi:hypothetical protein
MVTVTSIAAGELSVWVGGGGPQRSGWLWRVAASGNRVIGRVRLPDVQDVAVTEDAVWAVGSASSDGSERALFRISPHTEEIVATIPLDLGSESRSPKASSVVADSRAVWVGLPTGISTGDIVRVDPRTNDVAARIAAGGGVGDMALGGDALWFLSDPSGEALGDVSLRRIDPGANQIVATPVRGRLPDLGGTELLPRLVATRDVAWLRSSEDGSSGPRQAAVRVDTSTNQAREEALSVPHFSPVAVIDGDVWFIGRGGLSRLDSSTLEADPPLFLPVTPVDASLDPEARQLWVAGYDGDVARVSLR